MIVQLGNSRPVNQLTDAEGNHTPVPADNLGGAPTVTYISIPAGYSVADSADVKDIALHLAQNPDVTNLPEHEALLSVVHQAGAWNVHSQGTPTWVSCPESPALEAQLAEFCGAARGVPADVEDTHHTLFGAPGVGPHLEATALLVNSGRDAWAAALGGTQAGMTNTSTGTTATSLSDTGQAWTVNQWAGARVVCGGVWANIISNTATALTVDRWYAPATPGGAAGSTPGATTVYVILDGKAPSWFVGLGNTNTAPVSTDTSMSGEIVTAGGGLVRKIAPFAHTAGTNTYSLTPVFTANGSDVLAVTVYRIGVFSSMVVADVTQTLTFETLLSSSATLSSIGDQLTVSEVVTGS